jgi:hypothetical protein
MVARSLNANLLTRTSHLLTQTNHLLTQTNHLLTRTTRQTILTETAEAEAAAAEAAAAIRQGRQENHHANQHKYPFKGSQDRRDVFKTEQLLRILPPMDSQ